MERKPRVVSIGATSEVKFDDDEKERAVLWPSRGGGISAIKLDRRRGFVLWRDVVALGDSRGFENFIPGGVCAVRERAGVSRGGIGVGADFWAGIHASVADGIAHGDEISAAGVGGGTGIRDESARSIARGTQRVCLYGFKHCVRIDGGIAGGANAGGEQDSFDLDHGGDGDLRRERDCGGGADYSCGSGGDGGFVGDGIYFECDRAADFSTAGVAAAFVAATIWFVGGAGDT